MPYTVVNKFIPESLYKLKAPYAMTPQSITIHNTYNDASALSEIKYMASNSNATSYHVAVDDKHVVQAIPFNRNAWHAGDGGQGKGNRASIGIEICYSKSGGAKYDAAEENAVEYISRILKDKGWGIDRVKWHRDWSGKNCPHRILDEGRAASVRKRIADKLVEVVPASNPIRTYLIEGDSGDAVRELQQNLNKAGFSLSVDGIYGNATTNAVKAFQRGNGLVADGVFGVASEGKLDAVIANLDKAPVIVKPSTVTKPKEEIELNLTAAQRNELAGIFKKARERNVFSSAEHETAIVDGTMSISRLLYLQSIIAGAALNGGKRIL